MSRKPATRHRADEFLRRLGREYRGHARLYLAGGTYMVLLGFRVQTEYIDYVARDVEDPNGFATTLRRLVRELDVSAEPAGPGDFIPLPSGWENRCAFIGRYGAIDVFTFDPLSTTLSKIARGTSRDVNDALALLRNGNYALEDLEAAFEEILPRLETESLRIDEDDFRRKFEGFRRVAIDAV